MARDRKVEAGLLAEGLQTESCNGTLLHEPRTVRNQAARPFQVFTPFWRTCLASGEPMEPLPAAWIHRPWEAPPGVLGAAGVELGRNYPRPVVSLLLSRELALEAYHRTRRG